MPSTDDKEEGEGDDDDGDDDHDEEEEDGAKVGELDQTCWPQKSENSAGCKLTISRACQWILEMRYNFQCFSPFQTDVSPKYMSQKDNGLDLKMIGQECCINYLHSYFETIVEI